MKITLREMSIECEASELSNAIQALREMATIAPSSSPATRANVAPVTSAADALRDLLRSKGIGFKYRATGKDSGKTLEEALQAACVQAGCDAESIALALATRGAESPDLADTGETLTEEGAF